MKYKKSNIPLWKSSESFNILERVIKLDILFFCFVIKVNKKNSYLYLIY